MAENLNVINERVDDIPILLAQLKRMEVARLLDEHIPTNGNREGVSLGQMVVGWLAFILSEANHRLSHVEPWAAQRLATLQACLDPALRAVDFSDDRLATGLDYLSQDAEWEAFERALNQNTIRVYDLTTERVRIDSTTASAHVSADGLFQLGHSKDHRPDLPQMKISLSVLDPLGLPLTTTIVSGEKADDPLYLPEIERVRATLGRTGMTYIGDAKMASQATRAAIHAHTDYYLCPLPLAQMSQAALEAALGPVWDGTITPTPITRLAGDASEVEHIADGFEYEVEMSVPSGSGPTTVWRERRLVIYSPKWAQRQQTAVTERLTAALADLASLGERRRGKRQLRTEAEASASVERILSRHRVKGLLSIAITAQRTERARKKYGAREADILVEESVRVGATRDETAIGLAMRSMGWRAYATNQSRDELSLEEAVLAYRGEYLIERGFGRLKGKTLSLTPIYLDSDERVTGLVRVLTIALRAVTLLEFSARRSLKAMGEKLAGIYPGNPKRATASPTTEMMLKAFEGITLSVVELAGQVHRHLTPFTAVQRRILDLFGFSPSSYLTLGPRFSEPAFHSREP
jgi:transposase